MQPDNTKEEIEKEIQKFYTKFKEIYTEEHYPEWFKFLSDYNKKFNETKRYNNEGHELGHYSIFYTPIPDEIKIMIIGNNSSWFVDKTGNKKKWFEKNEGGYEFSASSAYEKALKIVKKIQEKVPEHNLYTKGIFKFGRNLEKYFADPDINKLNYLENNTVGLNRLWIQHGPSGKKHEELTTKIKGLLKIPSKETGLTLVQLCEKWTKEIIKILQPQYLLLFGRHAQKIYKEGNFRNMHVAHCDHPSHTVEDKKKIEQIRDGIAGLLND